MKKNLLILVFLIQNFYVFAQLNTPDCTFMKVDAIQMNTTQPNKMDITISNSCLNCFSGVSGCVYLELQVVQTIEPFAVIAASNCNCLWTPNNNSIKSYSIDAAVSEIPNLNTIKVSLVAFECGCSDLPFSTNLGLSNFTNEKIKIYPNPTNSIININSDYNIKSIEVYDIQGRILETVLGNTKTLDISSKENGIYFLKITTEKGSKIEKIIKE
jgi:Secretion system C-terminal sorting domain